MKSIVLGGGCFWCLEAVYQQINGIEKVTSGYAGGTLNNPSYHKHGDHAEVIKVQYNENKISLKKIFEVFFSIHDPTTVNRQGNDVGSQYRSIILCNDYLESNIAHEVIDGISELWDNPVVTEVNLLDKFYPAEDYHQDFYKKNPGNSYCQVIINPKLSKFKKNFSHLLAK